jgi:hypothetical protein
MSSAPGTKSPDEPSRFRGFRHLARRNAGPARRGQWIITPDRAASIGVLLGLSTPVMFALPRRLFVRFAIAPEQYARGAIALVAPGMVLDTISAIWRMAAALQRRRASQRRLCAGNVGTSTARPRPGAS